MHTFEVDLENWPAVRRHNVIEDGIAMFVESFTQFVIEQGAER
jgi:hypothetical protein